MVCFILSSLPSLVFPPPFLVFPPPSLVFPPPSLVSSLPSLVFPPPFLVFSLPYLVFSPPSLVFSLPSLVFSPPFLVFSLPSLVFSPPFLVVSLPFSTDFKTVASRVAPKQTLRSSRPGLWATWGPPGRNPSRPKVKTTTKGGLSVRTTPAFLPSKTHCLSLCSVRQGMGGMGQEHEKVMAKRKVGRPAALLPFAAVSCSADRLCVLSVSRTTPCDHRLPPRFCRCNHRRRTLGRRRSRPPG